MIIFTCTACQKRLKAPEPKAGKSVRCPGCGELLQVPSPVSGPISGTPSRNNPVAIEDLSDHGLAFDGYNRSKDERKPIEKCGWSTSCRNHIGWIGLFFILLSLGHEWLFVSDHVPHHVATIAFWIELVLFLSGLGSCLLAIFCQRQAITASFGMLFGVLALFFVFMQGGPSRWVWLGSAEEEAIYEDFVRANDELVKMHGALDRSATVGAARPRLLEKAQECIRLVGSIKSLSEKKRQHLDKRYREQMCHIGSQMADLLLAAASENRLAALLVLWGEEIEARDRSLYAEGQLWPVVYLPRDVTFAPGFIGNKPKLIDFGTARTIVLVHLSQRESTTAQGIKEVTTKGIQAEIFLNENDPQGCRFSTGKVENVVIRELGKKR